jgi:hypothetical protein
MNEWCKDSCGDNLNRVPTEAMIRAAANFVVPSTDLRPKTLEAAHNRCATRRLHRRVRSSVLIAVCLYAISLPLMEYLAVQRSRMVAPSSSQMESRALEFSSHSNIGPTWGLMEAFQQLRRQQAARLGQAPHDSLSY